jgi:hypothetical protein
MGLFSDRRVWPLCVQPYLAWLKCFYVPQVVIRRAFSVQFWIEVRDQLDSGRRLSSSYVV